jgi:hypothetical protein
MRRLVRSEGYARTRLAMATLCALFGAAIVVRTFLSVGLIGAALPAYVLGALLVAYAFVRFREYRAARRAP